eukprot:TRINITY_DN1405_c1_g1_i1.p1 TRINITY_DN1405_c1_g1~~TRINITY_DN1405_c1_g1_i1.p1  ORF type:complete len:943 (-),score=156.18 TRINITY_DN1405_c1_g1_i1:108-2936(-)
MKQTWAVLLALLIAQASGLTLSPRHDPRQKDEASLAVSTDESETGATTTTTTSVTTTTTTRTTTTTTTTTVTTSTTSTTTTTATTTSATTTSTSTATTTTSTTGPSTTTTTTTSATTSTTTSATTTTSTSATTTTATTTTTTFGPTYIEKKMVKTGVVQCDSSNTVFIMYTETQVNTSNVRFMVDTSVNTAQNFACVRLWNNRWQYFSTQNAWLDFVPISTDILVAQIYRFAATAVDLRGSNSNYWGLQLGYAGGDLTFAISLALLQTGASEAASDATQRARTQVVISGTYMEAYTKKTTTTTTGAPTILGRYTIKSGQIQCSSAEQDGFIMYTQTGLYRRWTKTRPPPVPTHPYWRNGYTGRGKQQYGRYGNPDVNRDGIANYGTDYNGDGVSDYQQYGGTYGGRGGGYYGGGYGGYGGGGYGGGGYGGGGYGGYDSYDDYGYGGGYDSYDDYGGGWFLQKDSKTDSEKASSKVEEGSGADAQSLVCVRFKDFRWQYYHYDGYSVNRDGWHEFTPVRSDILLAQVFSYGQSVGDFRGKNSNYQGIQLGYAGGDVTFQPQALANSHSVTHYIVASGTNILAYRSLQGEKVFIPTTMAPYMQPSPYNQGGRVNVLTGGLSCTDSNTGNGFLMYTEQGVNSRWGNKFKNHMAQNFVCVRFENSSKWEYDTNWEDEPDRPAPKTSWHKFTPVATDILVAAVDYAGPRVKDLKGQNTRFQGIQQGYVEGDITFYPGQFVPGYPDPGEFALSGSYIARHAQPAVATASPATAASTASATPTAGSARTRVTTGGMTCTDTNMGPGFIMYSAQSVTARFSQGAYSQAFTNHAAKNFVCVRIFNQHWQFDTNFQDEASATRRASWYTFTPNASDVLVASVDFSRDTVTDLKGQNTRYMGIQAGYADGDLKFFANQYTLGYQDPGEFNVQGSYIVTYAPTAAAAGSSRQQH